MTENRQNTLLITVMQELTHKCLNQKKAINSKSFRLDFNERISTEEEQARDQSFPPLDLSRAEPAVMLLRRSFSSF